MLENNESTTNIKDDIIIYGETLEELQNRTFEVFESVRKQGLKLNNAKCLFNRSELIFLGHKITGEGIFPGKLKVEVVTDMSYPTNVKEL